MEVFCGFWKTCLIKRLFGVRKACERITVSSRIRGGYMREVLMITTISLIFVIFVKGMDLDGEKSKVSAELKGDVENIGKNVIFTEKFYLKHLPEVLEKDESLEDLNVMESGDVSVLPDDDLFSPDLNARTTTRYSMELEKEKDEKESIKTGAYPVHAELSYIDDEDIDYDYKNTDDIGKDVVRKSQVTEKDKEPGEDEQKRLLEYDTEENRKLLKLRKKRGYKDIAFGPQAEHLTMTDIFGETGNESRDPLMKKYGLESYGFDEDMENLEEAWGSVVFPSKFRDKKVWGYDKEGRPIYSEKNWIKALLSGKVEADRKLAGIGASGKPDSKKLEYSFPQKYYGVDGFLDSLGICSMKSLLDKYKSYIDNLGKGRKTTNHGFGSFNKRKNKKNKGPEIDRPDIDLNKRHLGQDKQTNWKLRYNMMEKEEADKLANDLEGVEDLKGVIEVLNLKNPSTERRDAEAVFREYYTSEGKYKENINDSSDNVITLDVELALPTINKSKSKKKTLCGWREALFDQAIDNLGKYDPRAKKYGTQRGNDEIKGIPPSRIITNLSSEALRRPETHHTFYNAYKGMKNLFFNRLEKKYRQYVSELVELRSKDPTYNEMMNLANVYENRQEWLKIFHNPWLFIPKGIVFSEEVTKEQYKPSDENEYEKELLALELDSIPTRNIDIFMEQHLKGDVLFPDEVESQEQKEAMFRKIMKETAIYNEKQDYKLPHRAKRSKNRLPMSGSYNPTEAIRKKEELNKKTLLTVKGRVVATPTEKQMIKVFEKDAKKTMESKTGKRELDRKVVNSIIYNSDKEGPDDVRKTFTFGTKVKKQSGFSGEEHLNDEHIYKDEGRGPRNIEPPFSTTAVSVIRPRQKTAFDQISKNSESS
ncbi:hypothetical protein FG379_002580 [Cryptosporidium bovis]|uniref:uncharacterized protein n=1 Tax=Cryptosporidium bovis TaxID=310047 RepID=UPI00351A8BE5|nr:hypothetical protein FG379_002580 [Cryptosporidium bovis]